MMRNLEGWQAFFYTLHKIQIHDIVSSDILADKFRSKDSQEWTKQASEIVIVSTGLPMVEVIAKSHF